MKRAITFAIVILVSMSSASSSQAFFEERVEYGGRQVSTVHFHLVRALSRCVGFDAVESETIAAWSQIVDSGALDSTVIGHVEQHFSTREGPNDPFFHWSRELELSIAKNWVTGRDPLYECMNDDCSKKRPIYTGLQPKSHEAFGTFLHMIADSYSHSQCIALGYREHTDETVECELDDHFTEFGPEAADRTYAGIKAIFKELNWWAIYNGTFPRANPSTMEDTIVKFVTQSSYWLPEDRVKIADELYGRCAALDERDHVSM